MPQSWGLHYSFNNYTICLPLLHVQVAADIKELAAQVKLTQTYSNDTWFPVEAKYSFPIPARAAVCSVVMIKQDGTRVVASVLEKQAARETYRAAISQGQQAGLMEQQTADVFEIAVGNIQVQETVRIELIYATELAEDEDNDSIRFHLPVHVGARYGQAPPWDLATCSVVPALLQIFVNVQAVAPIAQIGSPSHTVSTELGPDPALPNAKDLPFSNYARVSLSSETALDKDFVLTVKSAGLDAPRCVAELHPTQATVAMALTLVPRFKLPDLPRQEFIFLVDRSGSMQGQRIKAAKQALVVMLRSLPAKDSLFQIMSFGSTCTMLWEDGSRPYTQTTLDDATGHVDGMQANYGGTEIRAALAYCFAARKPDRPTSLFVLTDGAAWDVNGVLSEVKASVKSCTAQTYLRVFVLGIGNSASTAMCEGIARVGNGTCMMVGEQETNFTGKIARMLRAARTPLITDIAVDWGVPIFRSSVLSDGADDDGAFVMVSGREGKGVRKIMDLYDETLDPLQMEIQPAPPPPDVVLSPPPQVQQSPFKIQTLSPGNRLNVYTILQGKAVPKIVTLTGLTEDETQIRLLVPVTLSNLPNAPDSPPAIHALAAHKLIQDLEDGQHGIATSNPDDADLLRRTVKASIVRLAKAYSISSSQTSFVAVDESDLSLQHLYGPVPFFPLRDRLSPREPAVAQVFRRRPNNSRKRRISDDTTHDTLQYPSIGISLVHVDDAASKDTQYLRRQCANCQKTDPPSWRRSTLHPGQIVCNSCRLYERTHLRSRPLRFDELRHGAHRSRQAGSPAPANDPLEALARLQSFDGCFSPDILSIAQLNVDLGQARAMLLDISEVFATVIAMAYLYTKLGPTIERESWEVIYSKARAFVAATLLDIGDFFGVDELETRAISLLA
ncbi:von Willebrand factor type A domain-containing protein [Mycena polygramma]|nr:von Willebrand factor type A domain-containing protein [Mycena polygramma]